MITLRDYQTNAVTELWEKVVDEHLTTMLALPTGSGKTEIIIEFVKRYIESGLGGEMGRTNVTIIVPSKHLVGQTGQRFFDSRIIDWWHLTNIYGSQCVTPRGRKESGSWSNANGLRPHGVVVITGQSYINRAEKDNATLVIADEAHHFPNPFYAEICEPDDPSLLGTELVYDQEREEVMERPYKEGTKSAGTKWGDALKVQKDRGAYVLGVTATPYRLTLNEMFRPMWESLIQGPSIPALIQDDYLCDFEFKDMESICEDIGFQLLTSNRRKSESDEQAAARLYREADYETLQTLTERVPEIWAASGQAYTPTVIFALNVKHAHNVHDCFLSAGHSVGVVAGDENNNLLNGKQAARSDVITSFENKVIDVLINVGVLKEGFDCPDAETLIVLRPTSSKGLMLQMYGRVLRRKSNGRHATIVDVTDNADRLGLPYNPVLWSLGPRPP